MAKLAYTVQEAAEMLGISRTKAYELTNVVGFPCFRAGRKKLIPRAGLEQWIENEAKKGGRS